MLCSYVRYMVANVHACRRLRMQLHSMYHSTLLNTVVQTSTTLAAVGSASINSVGLQPEGGWEEGGLGGEKGKLPGKFPASSRQVSGKFPAPVNSPGGQ